ncbi:MAG: hypothetical protein KBC66_08845 [Kiritimatiellae bacterium]|jgi:hypothetical protein|nr:hypothetical protein [Kiritimatiellia bacterium]NLD89165.1 hypothetical protein [Lentisphaerota bacterium]HPC19358.1 hypothetical protein [Kiritimatiellia bacterium]
MSQGKSRIAVMVLLIGSVIMASGATPYVETWNEDIQGWGDRDAAGLAVQHDSESGIPPGALMGMFSPQEVPMPEADAFHATATSSAGAYIGNYWQMQDGFFGWRFDFYAARVLPSDLVVRFGGAGNVFFTNVKPQVGGTGTWYAVQTPATYEGWFGGTEIQWSNALANVEFVEVQLTRNTTQEQIYYIDNFSNTSEDSSGVVLYYFIAREENGHVVLHWRTASENDTVGYWVERWDRTHWVRVNDEIIYARGDDGMGTAYALVDDKAKAGVAYRYRLVEEEVEGEQVYGPFHRIASALAFPCPVMPAQEGMCIRWLSRQGENYNILRTSDMCDGFVPIAIGIAATPPENEYIDKTAGSRGIYRIELQED